MDAQCYFENIETNVFVTSTAEVIFTWASKLVELISFKMFFSAATTS